ncbi:uncharacterized protein GGS22DRAFT_200513 [Annulohypoxylon maeteangense]|uniref:uncharacterized protein n=1 Tax=Annulohypoxylon maeteangense TaxID=1927788 RepID=UPI002008422F|nr:uncharacterized protein GGS22DRAFT_200513 [Annulohypoxylon maeteangense]KAI0884850.1 hypothetical protein GGS22DRAFT_200513 [Annulohypoxylon maeteangense]
MPRKRVLSTSNEERENRAARKRLRTEWRTDATEGDKKKAIDMAVSKLGGKKYSWMSQASTASSSANTAAAATRGETTFTSTSSSTDKPIKKPTSKRATGGLKAPEVEQVRDTSKSQLPTPELSSPAQPSPGDAKVSAVAAPVTPASSESTPPTSNASKKRKRGGKEEPITVSSRDASPIVIPSRDGSPAPPPQTPKAKRAKTAHTLVDDGHVAELKAVLDGGASEQPHDSFKKELEDELVAAFENDLADDQEASFQKELEDDLVAAFEEDDPVDTNETSSEKKLTDNPEATSEEEPADKLEALFEEEPADDLEAAIEEALAAELEAPLEAERERDELYHVLDYAWQFMTIA